MSSEKVVHLNISELVLCQEPTVISTILGSCVSVCLYSPEMRMGGMIHFALPSQEYASQKAIQTPSERKDSLLRFGKGAILTLITEFSKQCGLPPTRLKAKIVGGAAVVEQLKQSSQIGALNIAIAEQILREHQIPIVGRDVGGDSGRKVIFYTETGRLRVAPIKQSKAISDIPKTTKTSATNKKTKVLIVDDSKTIRELLTRTLSSDPLIEVIGTASDAIEADKLIDELRPDVITLDIHMPKMDGITFLEKILPKKPIPVVMITSISLEESNAVFRALELGAVDYIQKPTLQQIRDLTPLICEKVRSAASVKIKRIIRRSLALTKPVSGNPLNHSTIVAIGASTGGTEALKEVLIRLPKEIPPIVIVQHIPPVFSTAFANRLNDLCSFEVKEAESKDLLRPGRVLIAPGGYQMAIEPCSEGYRVKIMDAPPVNRHKPSVDVLFDSVAQHVKNKAIGVILTGMGDDGAKGLLKMKNSGARTLSQDQASCVVYGMPKVAFELGAVQEVHPLEKIPEVLVQWLALRK